MTPDELLSLLPRFEAKTRRRAAVSVAGRLSSRGDLEAAARAALEEREALRASFSAAAEACFRAAPRGRSAALEAACAAASGRPPTRAERRAIARGSLELEGLGERVVRATGRLDAEALVAFLGAHALAMRSGQLPAPLAELACRLAAEKSWRLSRAALLGLAEHAGAGRTAPAAALATARSLAGDPRAPTWAQTAALELLAAALGPAAAPLLEARLAAPSASAEDDFFVRAAAARVLARVSPPRARQVLPTLASDPSEHLRIELSKLLAAVEAPEALARLTDAAFERSARVRAAAAYAVANVAPEALVAVLEKDPDPVPRRAALEAAEPHAPRLAALRQAIEHLAVDAPWPELCRQAAEAAERVHHVADPGSARALSSVRSALGSLQEGQRTRLVAPVEPWALGRALALVSTDGFPLQARRAPGGWEILRGDRLRRRLWRVLHELGSPSPDKRQGYLHTVGRVGFGEVRAPPGGLAEVTATKVPGERVLVPRLGDWGRHLPTVDDLLSRPPGGALSLFSAFGVTHVGYPAGLGWLKARAALTLRYARASALRWGALTDAELRDRRRYLTELQRLGFTVRFSPHRPGGPAELVELFSGSLAPPPPPPALAVTLPVAELVRRWLEPSSSSLNHLAAVAFAAAGLFYLRLGEARRSLERARQAIPLSIGGWGTRGKSGTERLKAALFHGLGCEVLVKTTGCEAMLIHCLPGAPATEVFIYRTYDKATIWEQRDLVELAARFGVDVFLWECMALNPVYVELLEQRWMRDDYCTLTNTYPDHENIQGPAGIDIPRVMTRFMPRGRTLFTAEDQMAPILREAAKNAQTELVEVAWRDHALLPADVLARFPYDEHPRNIALVLKLAAALGIERDLALKEMADWVVPDLGVLKSYPEAHWRGRRLAFANGMSANERTGFINNWVRCGFDRPGAFEPGEWTFTVVNNRADRVSRSMVFADIVVDDAAAHAHVLIGTNLEGLSGFIRASLERVVASLVLFHADEGERPAAELRSLALARAGRALSKLKLDEVGARRLAAEAEAMARGLGAGAGLPPGALEEALAAAPRGADLAAARQAVAAALAPRLADFVAALGEHGPDAARHLVERTARHAAVQRWVEGLEAACASTAARDRKDHEQRFRALYRELFLASLVVLRDPELTGDQVVDAIARACPPGFRARIMGIQNIKGTGLDFAYRWVYFDRTTRQLRRLAAAARDEAVAIARELAEAQDVGVLDCAAAAEGIGAAAVREDGERRAALVAALARVRERLAEKESALRASGRAGRSKVTVALEKVLDVYDGIFRRRRADRVVDELVAGRVGHARAAAELRNLMKRQKGGWLFKRS